MYGYRLCSLKLRELQKIYSDFTKYSTLEKSNANDHLDI